MGLFCLVCSDLSFLFGVTEMSILICVDGTSNGFAGGQVKDLDPTGWELALVSTPSTDISSFQERQLVPFHVFTRYDQFKMGWVGLGRWAW